MWIAITTDNVRGRMSLDEIAGLEQGGETDSIDNKIPECISEVVDLVRAKVASCKINTLGIPGTIPSECKWAAISLIRHAAVASIKSYSGDTADREREYDSALAFLDQVAECKVSIVGPGGGTLVAVDQLEMGYETKLDFSL